MKKTGRLTRVIFNNESNGYTVAIFKTDDESLTVTGCFHNVDYETVYELEGGYRLHPKYGEQFNFTSYSEKLPEDSDGIRDFLASGTIKGVGPKTAELIVAAFGDQTLQVIESTPEKLLDIKGIGARLMVQIADSYREHRDFAVASLELKEFGIDMNQAVRIYKLYGSESVGVVSENPYCLVGDIYGITFRRADEIAARAGISAESEFRIRSGVKYALSEFAMSGSTFVPKEKVVERAIALMDVTTEQIEDNLVGMALASDIKTDMVDGIPVVYLYNYYFAEERVTHNTARLIKAEAKPIRADIDNLIADAEASQHIELSEEQRGAVTQALRHNLCIITGGPGTGKTTIINTIVKALQRMDISFALAAPTGRAAKRITETSGHPAMTIHRMLEYVFSSDREYMEFGRNGENPLEEEAYIIDEASMVDIMLMDGLMEAIPTGARLIIVGDADQLPSVGAGNVLRDMVRSEYIPTVRLRYVFRQAEESLIIANAHRINDGELPVYGDRNADFFFIHKDSDEGILEEIKSLVSGRLADCYPEFIRENADIQIITPTRKGVLGTANLNSVLQEILNPDGVNDEIRFAGKAFRVDDKVMQVKNNYQKEGQLLAEIQTVNGVFNGDMGSVSSVTQEGMTVMYDDKAVRYEKGEFEELELAYAITVHKSQGCEFPAVIIPMSSFPPMLMTRNLLYTGVTRGKRLVIIVGREFRMQQMVDNNRIDERYTGLDVRLRERDFGGIAGM